MSTSYIKLWVEEEQEKRESKKELKLNDNQSETYMSHSECCTPYLPGQMSSQGVSQSEGPPITGREAHMHLFAVAILRLQLLLPGLA